jgi:hypothetical protein
VNYRIVYSVLLIGSLSIGFLSGCGGTPQKTVTIPDPKVGEVLLTQQYVAENLKDYSVWLAGTVVNSIRSSAFGDTSAKLVAQQASAVCGFESIPINLDEDFVPKEFSTTFVDCVQDKGTYFEIKNGTFSIADENDDDPKVGATSGVTSRATNLSFDFYDRNDDGSLGNAQLTIKDTWDFTISKLGNTGALNYRLTMIGTKPGTKTGKGVLEFAGQYEVAGDANRNDYDNASITGATGVFTMNDTAKFNMSIDTLTFVNTCQATPTDGEFNLSDGANTFTLEFAGCENVIYKLNGETLFSPVQ